MWRHADFERGETRPRGLTESRPEETFYHGLCVSLCVCLFGYEFIQVLIRQRALRTWLHQSPLLIRLTVMTDRRNRVVEKVEGRETEQQWEGVWPELRFMFRCKNTQLESSSERSDRYSKVCQHHGKCTLVRWLSIAHIRHPSFIKWDTQKAAYRTLQKLKYAPRFQFKLKQQLACSSKAALFSSSHSFSVRERLN